MEGFRAGAVVVLGELLFFAFGEMTSVFPSLGLFLVVFFIVEIFQYSRDVSTKSKSYTAGFLVGDFAMLVLIGGAFKSGGMSSVSDGMLVAFLIVAALLIARVWHES